MLKLLLKKQLAEVFRSYFYNTKKNKARSKGAVITLFILYALLMIVVLGGIFTALSAVLCPVLVEAGMGWFYFVLMSAISVVLGAFGSIFNTYAGLYLSKDNDLLLSLPIPVNAIIASRLMNVFLLGAMYAGTVILPGLIVYWINAGLTAARLVGGIVLMLVIFLFVLILSCLLGWCVAKISQKLKNKSFVTVLFSLLFLGAYYYVYFRAGEGLQDFVKNAALYGEKVRSSAGWLYTFGRTGEGDLAAAALSFGVILVLLVLTWFLLKKTFLTITTSAPASGRKVYKEKPVGMKTPFRALLSREFSKFFSMSSYMLNCGLGVLLIPALGVLLLLKADLIVPLAQAMFADEPVVLAVIFGAALMLVSSMNDMAEPSVSLEGKNIWIPQSLPVEAKTVLRAKASVHLILTGVPMLFTLACVLIVLPLPAAQAALLAAIVLLYVVFSALFGTAIGVGMANLRWTNELWPIKQAGGVVIALFSGWVLAALFAGVYFLIGKKLPGTAYLGLWTALFLAADIFLWRWIGTKGAKRFSEL